MPRINRFMLIVAACLMLFAPVKAQAVQGDLDAQIEKEFVPVQPNAEAQFNSVPSLDVEKEFSPLSVDADKEFAVLQPDAEKEFSPAP
ncbi:MAG: hypothetical protein KGK03_01325 [Candidatus Omnitrophica bacterium]|nr:hypothetical protein [Candidatus Omnitrophota bacterium]MDE2221690.1 hypothetical protein [Candidatus Omnitrophota bacterium]